MVTIRRMIRKPITSKIPATISSAIPIGLVTNARIITGLIHHSPISSATGVSAIRIA